MTIGAITAAAALVLGTTVPAAATTSTYNISAELGCGGNLFQSGNFRPHSSSDGASIKLTKDDWWRSIWKLRIGLRNASDVQVTKTLELDPGSRSTHTWKTPSDSTSIPGGSLAVNARVAINGNGSCVLFPPTFEGKLTQ
ncbi:hypothetical protein ET475_06490 [Microbacterium protaetiae]|uniref:Secreted protein n=1 Tax=Microbacterium protaetiae TaxID=2509458 RepID=A0A4P6ECB7_9MICO|nr:hypothetical protein [Microbacterium protaetiae]QAY59674.1 hypothetical protein ET475_06490 [Microbacterium protaetiae]